MPEHSDLTGTNLHEPKGVAAASSGEVYIADGGGSGDWTQIYQYANVNTVEADAVSISSIGTTAQTLPFANDGESYNVVANAANNRITCTNAGVYHVTFDISFSTNASADSGVYEFKLMDDGVFTGIACARGMSGTADTGGTSFQGLISVNAGTHITIEIESDEAADTDDITIYSMSLTAFKVG